MDQENLDDSKSFQIRPEILCWWIDFVTYEFFAAMTTSTTGTNIDILGLSLFPDKIYQGQEKHLWHLCNFSPSRMRLTLLKKIRNVMGIGLFPWLSHFSLIEEVLFSMKYHTNTTHVSLSIDLIHSQTHWKQNFIIKLFPGKVNVWLANDRQAYVYNLWCKRPKTDHENEMTYPEFDLISVLPPKWPNWRWLFCRLWLDLVLCKLSRRLPSSSLLPEKWTKSAELFFVVRAH